MIDSHQEEVFIHPKGAGVRWVIAAGAALLLAAVVLLGYTYLRKQHAEKNLVQSGAPSAEPKAPPRAVIMVDEAMIEGNKSLVGGTVKNISDSDLNGLQVELELKRRKDGTPESKLVTLEPEDLAPEQEGRYSLELKSQDYSSAKLIGLRIGSDAIAFKTAPGRKRPLERLESKTITIDKRPPGKKDDFLNTPDKPARVP